MGIAFALLAAVLCGVVSCRTGSNEIVRIGSEISCPSCTIVIDSVVTLQGASVNAPASLMQRDSTGMYWFGEPGGLLKVYESDGRFVREIGRIGAGPGEYEMLRNVIPGNDGSVQVLDAALGRRSFFSRDGDFLGSTPVKVNRGIG
ncbi:MAG: 6-bladed beta-propeller, partial [Candidatus Binatia bacterium]